MASLSTLVEDISLVGEQIFDHTALIRNQINKFLDNFERNGRHKEFDGIIRASHSVWITNINSYYTYCTHRCLQLYNLLMIN